MKRTICRGPFGALLLASLLAILASPSLGAPLPPPADLQVTSPVLVEDPLPDLMRDYEGEALEQFRAGTLRQWIAESVPCRDTTLPPEVALANATAPAMRFLIAYDTASAQAFGGDAEVQAFLLELEGLFNETIFPNSGMQGRTVEITVMPAPKGIVTAKTTGNVSLLAGAALKSAALAEARWDNRAAFVFLAVRKLNGGLAGAAAQAHWPSDFKDPTYAYAVVQTGYAFAAVAHEWGHMMGLGHDRAHLAAGDPALQKAKAGGVYQYALGYLLSPEGGLTRGCVMAIAQVPQPVFSNIRLSYQGLPVGERGKADAVRALEANWDRAVARAGIPWRPKK